MTRTGRVPQLQVSFDGAPMVPVDTARLQEATVMQRANLPDQAELAFRGQAPAGSQVGAALRVEVGGGAVPLFTGAVTAVEHVLGPDSDRTTRVRGYDRLQELRARSEVTAVTDTTLASLARERAAAVGLSVQATADGPRLARVIQQGQSDLAVLQELAARCGVAFHLRQDTLQLFGPEGVGETLALRWGHNLREARVDVNASAAGRAVRVDAWDLVAVTTVSGDEPGTDGEGAGPVRIAGAAAGTDEEARAMARSEAVRRAAAARALWAVADGDPRLRPGAVVDLSEADASLAGRYTLGAVVHRVDDRASYSSEMSSTPPWAPPRRADGTGLAVQLGTIARVDDPEGLGRVVVALDALDGAETEWLHVVTAGAGPDKGIVALPDVDDRVVVLATARDPGRGVVLGALYGATGAPDAGVVDGRVKRFTMRTAGGQVLRLDDDRRLARLEDGTGSFIELSPEQMIVHAAVDLRIEAPGRSVIVTAASVDFNEG
jgi:phage protein D/phage baseplate assembly protein gpV